MTTTTLDLFTTDPDPAASDYTCAAFALCGRQSIGWAAHPILGAYPSCARCADRLGTALRYQCAGCGESFTPIAGEPLSVPCGERAGDTWPLCPDCRECHIAECTECALEDTRTADRS